MPDCGGMQGYAVMSRYPGTVRQIEKLAQEGVDLEMTQAEIGEEVKKRMAKKKCKGCKGKGCK